MEVYLCKICIFICLCELLGNFSPSKQYEKVYRYISGIFIILAVMKPLGENVVQKLLFQEGYLTNSYTAWMEESRNLWRNGDIGQIGISEAEMRSYLQGMGLADKEEE